MFFLPEKALLWLCTNLEILRHVYVTYIEKFLKKKKNHYFNEKMSTV